jgi:hypothetical protein
LLESKLLRIANEVYDSALELCSPMVPKSRLILNKNMPFIDDLGAAITMRDEYIEKRIEKIKDRRRKNNYNLDY